MSKYDKEIDSRTAEFEEAREPLEKATSEVPPPREHQRDDSARNDDEARSE